MLEGIRKKQPASSKFADMVLKATGPYFTKNLAKGLTDSLIKLNANSKEAMMASLHNKIALAKLICEREKNLFGRLINKISKETNPCDIEVTGVELNAILNYSKEQASCKLYADAVYYLPITQAYKALDLMKNGEDL